MKTATIKTDFWKEDRIFELLPDARFFYLCILSNPERTSTPAFKCSDRLMSAYTGYNIDTIKMCKKELIKKGFIEIVEDYYVICDQEYVKLTKGKLSYQLYEKDFALLPLKVQELLRSRSGAAQDNINIDNNIDIDSDINKDIINTSDDTKLADIKASKGYEMAKLLESLMAITDKDLKRKEKPVKERILLNWSVEMERLQRIDGYGWDTIEFVLRWCQQDSFWRTNISSAGTFRKKFRQLGLQAKRDVEYMKGVQDSIVIV